MSNTNKEDGDTFEIGSAKELREKYGLVAKNRPEVRLEKARVPQALWPLMPDAELLGIADDLVRDDVWRRLPEVTRNEITARVKSLAAELDDWLGGPEADSPNPTAEYVAFSALRLVAD